MSGELEFPKDGTPPEVAFTLSPNGWTNGTMTACLTGRDSESGFAHFAHLGTGEEFDGSELELVFRQNETVTLRGYDGVDLYTDTVISVTNIDTTPPVLELRHNQGERGGKYDPVVVHLAAMDAGSGVKGFALPDDTFQEGDAWDYTITRNGSYVFVVYDHAGNKTMSETVVIDAIEDPTDPGEGDGNAGDGKGDGSGSGDGDGDNNGDNNGSGDGNGSGGSIGSSDPPTGDFGGVFTGPDGGGQNGQGLQDQEINGDGNISGNGKLDNLTDNPNTGRPGCTVPTKVPFAFTASLWTICSEKGG